LSNSTVNTYNCQAKDYETKWEKYLAHTHDAFLRRIETDADDKIIDISGGTGLLVRKLIEQNYPFEHLIINDPSDQMLGIARERFSANSRISFASQKVEQLSYDKNYFDRIFCLSSFHFYKNQQQVLDHFYSMLKPGGRFYLLDWNRSGFFSLVNQLIKWYSSEYIDTRSLSELKEMCYKSDFEIHTSDEWTWRYWNFLFFEGYKPK
jgi:ubiquinone/menaquinone biosynthesis C-methylase UbiE